MGREGTGAWDEVCRGRDHPGVRMGGSGGSSGESASGYLCRYVPSPLLRSWTDPSSAGAGTTMRSFLLPTLSSSINIRETTLLGHSTGFRTWGSAPLLARLLCTSPDQFFATKSPVPRRILELGSGTGLVGMVVASLLVDQDVSIHLTDFDPIILTNLSHNLSLNPSISPLQVSIMPLDWSTFYTSRLDPQPTRPRYYTIFAADVIFEPSHVPWIHATVSALLDFPSSSSPSPTLHLILPLRRTHSDHTLRFDAAFSPADIGRAEETEERTSVDEEGQRWRLSTQDRMTLRGPDGFGTGKEVRDDGEYWLYRIGWIKVTEEGV